MPEVILTERTVPGTDVVITVSRKTSLTDGKVHFRTVRDPGTSDIVNYLLFGRDTEAEAREVANFLWTDTVTRRDAKAVELLESTTYEIGQFVTATCLKCNDRTSQQTQSSPAIGLVLKCGRCGNRSLRSPLVKL
jgi:hypothetical protein